MTIVSLNNHKNGFVTKKLKWNKFDNLFYIMITLAKKISLNNFIGHFTASLQYIQIKQFMMFLT